MFDDELTLIAREVGSRAKAFKLVKRDKKLVRFYLPLVRVRCGHARTGVNLRSAAFQAVAYAAAKVFVEAVKE